MVRRERLVERARLAVAAAIQGAPPHAAPVIQGAAPQVRQDRAWRAQRARGIVTA